MAWLHGQLHCLYNRDMSVTMSQTETADLRSLSQNVMGNYILVGVLRDCGSGSGSSKKASVLHGRS
jgi:hypothetical protein